MFDETEYNSKTSIVKIIEFVERLVKKKGKWTQSREGAKVLHDISVSLSKTSPKVFLDDWKNNGDLHPSPEATLWAAEIRVLCCAFVLQVQIRTTVKAILKNKMKDLKSRGKSLTFDVACVLTRTKTGRFITGKPAYQPFAKRQCVPKQFTREHQSFLEVTICGNNVGILKYPHFVEHFRDMLTDIMLFEPRLVVIPYPNKDASNKSLSFANDCSMLFSSYCCQIYLKSL